MYTCVAWNTEGADTKSVSVFVDSHGSVGWWSGGGRRWGVKPSREQPWLGNSSGAAASLVVLAKVLVHIEYFHHVCDQVDIILTTAAVKVLLQAHF